MLAKHVRRYIYKYNRWLVLAICALVFVMGILFYSIMLMSNSYNQQLDELNLNGSQEHFSFVPIEDREKLVTTTVDELEAKFNFTSEQQSVKYYYSDDVYYKFLNAVEHINKPVLVEGELVSSSNELVIDVKSAERIGLSGGDAFQLEEQLYHISGVAIFPSQLSPNMNPDGYIPYNSKQSIIFSVSSSLYETLDYKEQSVFAARWNSEAQLIDDRVFSYFIEAENNPEMNGLLAKLQMNLMIAGSSTGVLATIVIIVLLLLVYKMIKDNEQAFALLKSIGYKNSQFVAAFVPLISILILPLSFACNIECFVYFTSTCYVGAHHFSRIEKTTY